MGWSETLTHDYLTLVATHFIMKRAESLPTSKQVKLEEQSRCREVTYYVSLDRLTIREVMLHCNVYVIHSPTMPTGQYSMYPNYSTYITLSLSLSPGIIKLWCMPFHLSVVHTVPKVQASGGFILFDAQGLSLSCVYTCHAGLDQRVHDMWRWL